MTGIGGFVGVPGPRVFFDDEVRGVRQGVESPAAAPIGRRRGEQGSRHGTGVRCVQLDLRARKIGLTRIELAIGVRVDVRGALQEQPCRDVARLERFDS